MKIVIDTIAHDQHPYPTAGDWRFDSDGTLQIRVSKLSDWRYEALVAIHELAEVLLCKQKGITTEQVDRFDIHFEDTRENGNEDEPGDDPESPYRKEHCIATAIERMMAAELDVSWKRYEEELAALP